VWSFSCILAFFLAKSGVLALEKEGENQWVCPLLQFYRESRGKGHLRSNARASVIKIKVGIPKVFALNLLCNFIVRRPALTCAGDVVALVVAQLNYQFKW